MSCPKNAIKDMYSLVALWKHECTRVFADRLNTVDDKIWFDETIARTMEDHFGSNVAMRLADPVYFADFLRDDIDGRTKFRLRFTCIFFFERSLNHQSWVFFFCFMCLIFFPH